MSHAAMTWAQRARTGSGTRKCVLLLMADGADEHGVLWWGLKKLVEYSELSRRTVLAALDTLQEAGLILRITRRRENGTQRSSLYVLAPTGDRGPMRHWKDGEEDHAAAISEALAALESEQGAGAAPCDERGAADAQRGAAVAEQGAGAAPLESSLEPSLGSGGARERENTDISALLDRLSGPVADGLLIDPRFDGGDRLLEDNVRQHGLDVVADALDEIVAFASRRGPAKAMQRRHISYHLAAAVRRVKATRRDTAGTPEDRPSWTEATNALDAAMREHTRDDALGALRQLEAQAPLLALLAVEIGWGAWCDRPTGDAYGARDADQRNRATYNRLRPDPDRVSAAIVDLELVQQQRAALARGENPYDPAHPLNRREAA